MNSVYNMEKQLNFSSSCLRIQLISFFDIWLDDVGSLILFRRI